eukprot:tig00001249_g7776.t1
MLKLHLSSTPRASQKDVFKFVACRTEFLERRLRGSSSDPLVQVAHAARAVEGVAQGLLDQISEIVAKEAEAARLAAAARPPSPASCLDGSYGWCGGGCFGLGREAYESPRASARCAEALAQRLSDGISSLNSLAMSFRALWCAPARAGCVAGRPASGHAAYALEEFLSFFVMAAELFLRALVPWEAVCAGRASKVPPLPSRPCPSPTRTVPPQGEGAGGAGLRRGTAVGLLRRAQACCETVHFISSTPPAPPRLRLPATSQH